MAWFKDNVSQKKRLLCGSIKAPMAQLAEQAVAAWGDSQQLNHTLQNAFCKLPNCHLLYALTPNGHQCSANVARGETDMVWLDQDLSQRPLFKGHLPYKGMSISVAYMSQRSMKPCLTALQAVRQGETLLGFIAADIHLNDLPTLGKTMSLQLPWHQPKGATSLGERLSGEMDKHIDYLIYLLSTLMQEHGVFQVDMHFNHDRCLLWTADDPWRYRIHQVEALLEAELLERYPQRDFPQQSLVDAEGVPLVFGQFKALREIDDVIHLHSVSLNLLNGMVGLGFCSDASHYLPVGEFMNTSLDYWFGELSQLTGITDSASSIKN